jgi:hypothetical protein
MGKEKIIPIFAIIILVIAGTSSAYVFLTQVDKETITINQIEYTIDQLFFIGDTKTIQTVEGEKTGISMENLVIKIGVNNPSEKFYTLSGSDGYEQTVEWDIMRTGILTNEKAIFFPDTPKKFWVKDIINIEVS